MAKAKTKTQRVKDLLAKGKSAAEIVKITGASPQLVYSVRAKYRAQDTGKASGITTITAKSPIPYTGIAGLGPRPPVTEAPPAPEKTFWQKVCAWFTSL